MIYIITYLSSQFLLNFKMTPVPHAPIPYPILSPNEGSNIEEIEEQTYCCKR